MPLERVAARLLDLPDKCILRIFHHLLPLSPVLPSSPPRGAAALALARPHRLHGRAMHTGGADAFALACTARRLLALFAADGLVALDPHIASPVLGGAASGTTGVDAGGGGGSGSAGDAADNVPLPAGLVPVNPRFASRNSIYQQWPPPRTSAVEHVVALVRLSAGRLKDFGLHAHPPERRMPYRNLLPDFPVVHPGDLTRTLDPTDLLEALVTSRSTLHTLRITHPKLLCTDSAVTSFRQLLMQNANTIVALHATHMQKRFANCVLTCLPSTGILRDLRLPKFGAGIADLVALLARFGPGLETLEIGCSRTHGSAAGSGDAALARKDSDRSAELALAANSCGGITTLSISSLPGHATSLAFSLIRSCTRLRSLSLNGFSGHLGYTDCVAVPLIQSALRHCPDLAEIHMIDCNVIGESADLFNTVGQRLRSFTGRFYWETSRELLTFSAYCPNVESVSLRCGGDFDDKCNEGAVTTIRRFGNQLRELAFSNANLDEESFITAICAATHVEELELGCDPKLSTDVLNHILSTIGGNLRVLTIGWTKLDGAAALGDGSADFELLRIITRTCPLLETVHLPDLWYDANLDSMGWERARLAVGLLHERLRYFSVFDSVCGNPRDRVLPLG
jgi:hypothetical protein